MKNLPIEILRSFVTIIEVRSFTQAGDLLGRSQPAISLQIKRLEELVGQPLITRSGQQVELTQAGEYLFGYAKRILALNDEALASLSTTTISGQIKLGIPSEFATTLLPKIVSRFAHTYPNIHLEVVSDLSRNLLAKAAQKQFDLILVLSDDSTKASKSLILEDDLVWVTSAHHDTHIQTPLSFIAAPEGCIYRKRASAKLNQAGIDWRITYTNPDVTGMQAAIEEGLGVTVLAKSTVPGNLKIIRESERFPALGKVGINLEIPKGEVSESVQRLAEYLKASLSGN